MTDGVMYFWHCPECNHVEVEGAVEDAGWPGSHRYAGEGPEHCRERMLRWEGLRAPKYPDPEAPR